MVARKFLRAEFFVAVLAAEFVSEVDVLTREFDFAPAKTDVPKESHHGRNLQRGSRRVHTPIAFLKNFDFLQKHQLYRPFPVDDVKRFKGCVEKKDLFEGVTPWVKSLS